MYLSKSREDFLPEDAADRKDAMNLDSASADAGFQENAVEHPRTAPRRGIVHSWFVTQTLNRNEPMHMAERFFFFWPNVKKPSILERTNTTRNVLCVKQNCQNSVSITHGCVWHLPMMHMTQCIDSQTFLWILREKWQSPHQMRLTLRSRLHLRDGPPHEFCLS